MVATMYPSNAPLGGDICTGGPAGRTWTFGMFMNDAFSEALLEAEVKYKLHATLGCELIDGPIDAPSHLPAGSTRMDWFPRGTSVLRENLPLHCHDEIEEE